MTVGRLAVLGGSQALGAAVGEREGSLGERLTEDPAMLALQTAVGAVAGPAVGKAINVGGKVVKAVAGRVDAIKKAMMLQLSRPVQNEVRRIAASSKVSPEEIVARIQKGEIFADMSEQAAEDVSGINITASEGGATIKEAVEGRAERLPRDARDQLRRDLTEGASMDDNVTIAFEKTKKEIENGFRETIRFRKDAGFTKTIIKEKLFVIIRGQMAYIAQKGEIFKAQNGEEDARLRVIYDNGTENDLLQRSLIRAMYKDETSRFVTSSGLGPLFSDELESDDLESGTIYVLRSNSKNPEIIKNREIYHKIGVTGNDINKRIQNAKNDPTFLMADVEVIATYKLANIKRHKLENLIQSFFKNAKLDINIKDRFGKPVNPKEWFLVPLFVIDEVVEKIKEGTISDYYYDVNSASLKSY